MRDETAQYTAILPVTYLDELKEMVKEKKIPSVNFAINEALEIYLKSLKAMKYEALMMEAGRDKTFLARTSSCTEDFKTVDNEIVER
jgi:hypothetical protein